MANDSAPPILASAGIAPSPGPAGASFSLRGKPPPGYQPPKPGPAWASRIIGYASRPPAALIANPLNFRRHPSAQQNAMRGVLAEVGLVQNIVVNERTGRLIDGHLRLELALEQGQPEVPCTLVDLSEEEERLILATFDPIGGMAIPDPQANAELLAKVSAADPNLAGLLDALRSENAGAMSAAGKAQSQRLGERFLVAPFSVLSAREGWWQDRKRAWLALGLKSEVGRHGNLLHFSETAVAAVSGRNLAFRTDGNIAGERGGTSIFDPVLCELAYRWFCPPGGLICDPFAGGSVRGIVASKLGRGYIGFDLRAEQVAANVEQAHEILGESGPDAPLLLWFNYDSRRLAQVWSAERAPAADFIFSCPPYGSLERYSDDPADLSTLEYPEFRAAHAQIIAQACAMLKPDRFAAWVVGEFRGPGGGYVNFVGDTIEAFRAAGLEYYNEAILLTAIGSLPIRAARNFTASRKLGKTHQQVLIFCKGDPRAATAACGEVEIDFPDPAPPDPELEGAA